MVFRQFLCETKQRNLLDETDDIQLSLNSSSISQEFHSCETNKSPNNHINIKLYSDIISCEFSCFKHYFNYI